jgi:hypothetical protein
MIILIPVRPEFLQSAFSTKQKYRRVMDIHWQVNYWVVDIHFRLGSFLVILSPSCFDTITRVSS